MPFSYLVLNAAGDRTRSTRIASIVAAVAVHLFACFMYVDAIFIHVSSTSALIFVFGPLYLAVGGFLVFAIAQTIGNKLAARNDA